MKRKDEIKDNSIMSNMKNILDDVMTYFEKAVNYLTKMTLDELADVYTKNIDSYILQQEKENNLRYAGGEFSIIYATEKSFSLQIELYFQNKDNEWEKMESAKDNIDMKYLKPEAVQELAQKKKVVFDVEHPSVDITTDADKDVK